MGCESSPIQNNVALILWFKFSLISNKKKKRKKNYMYLLGHNIYWALYLLGHNIYGAMYIYIGTYILGHVYWVMYLLGHVFILATYSFRSSVPLKWDRAVLG